VWGCAAAAALGGCTENPADAASADDGPAEISSYQEGSIHYLETRRGRQVARIGVDWKWGGSIVAAELNGVNMVNNFDPMGRQIQLSLYDGAQEYDGCAGCTNVWGWNPVQAGDRAGNPGQMAAVVHAPGGLFVRMRPNQYVPENKGGGVGRPVLSDVIVEQRITAIPNHPLAFQLEYRIIHIGNDRHEASMIQEFPAVYVTVEHNRFVRYEGDQPWTNGQPTASAVPRLFTPEIRRFATSELWASFVNRNGTGITIYNPGAYPYMIPGYFPGPGGPTGVGSSYLYAVTPFGLEPHQEVVGEVYLIMGDYRDARRTIYELRKTLPVRDISAPVGGLELPSALSGTVRVTGWAHDNVEVASVELFADDSLLLARLMLDQNRSDVSQAWSGARSNSGFRYDLDSRRLSNGSHRVFVRMTDSSGNVSIQSRTAQVRN
jgi:hypothetical protein